jgi:dTDP-4-dehydrorhamnose reductase
VPTPASFIADATAQLIVRRQSGGSLKDWSGVLNLVPSGRTSWFDYASLGLAILHRATQAGGSGAGMPQAGWQVPRMPVLEPIPAASYPTPARRPANSSLDLSRIENIWGLKMPEWDSLLATVLRGA